MSATKGVLKINPSAHNLSKHMNYNRNVFVKYLKIKRQSRCPEAFSEHRGPLSTRRALQEQRGTVKGRWLNTYGACVCRAALLSLDNKASECTLSYLSVGVKEIAAPSAASRGEKARPSQIQSALREMKRNAGYSLLPEKTQPGTGGRGKGDLTSRGL